MYPLDVINDVNNMEVGQELAVSLQSTEGNFLLCTPQHLLSINIINNPTSPSVMEIYCLGFVQQK